MAAEHHNLEKTIRETESTQVLDSPPLPSAQSTPISNEKKMNGGSSSNETAPARKLSSNHFNSDEDDFFDAVSGDDDSDVDEEFLTTSQNMEGEYMAVSANPDPDQEPKLQSPSSSNENTNMTQINPDPDGGSAGSEFQHRRCLPANMFSRDEFSIWHILRQCIGKELSKITMPVIFNEPLSFIQRLCEYMEYSRLLQRASMVEESIKRLEMVTAFAISALASQLERLGKPFNPLLGETFEYKREDLGFHWISEQVSHHPPQSAFYASGTDPNSPFHFRGCVHPKLKFWGKTVEIEPKGVIRTDFPNHDEYYTWSNPKCSVHNIVVGKLWMEQHGVMKIVNHKTGERCVVTFKPYSWFKNDLNKVEAVIYDSENRPVRYIHGNWTKYVYVLDEEANQSYLASMTSGEASTKTKKKKKVPTNNDEDLMSDVLSALAEDDSYDCRCLWQVEARPECSTKMYNMTEFAMTLNQPDVNGYSVPPTDSRLRPDMRNLENGNIDGATSEKHRLEEAQRARRKARNKKNDKWEPRWFELVHNSETKSDEWTFKPYYMNRDWTNSPKIF